MKKTPSPLAKRVYALTEKIPTGKVTTYKAIGQALHSKAYRAIGQILRFNPNAPEVPCHRVVASDGRLNGFNGSRGQKELTRKTALLKKEGVAVKNYRVVNFESALFTSL